jgi:hypothetical protein
MSITVGNWSVGTHGSTVVSDVIPENHLDNMGRDDLKYYGGFLIAESMRKDDAAFLANCKNILLQAAIVVKEVNRGDLESVRELERMIAEYI